MHLGLRDRGCAGGDHVLNFLVNDFANEELVQVWLTQVRISRPHRLSAAPPDGHVFELGEAENIEVNRVVQIMTVISDFVSQICDLRFK